MKSSWQWQPNIAGCKSPWKVLRPFWHLFCQKKTFPTYIFNHNKFLTTFSRFECKNGRCLRTLPICSFGGALQKCVAKKKLRALFVNYCLRMFANLGVCSNQGENPHRLSDFWFPNRNADRHPAINNQTIFLLQRTLFSIVGDLS